MGQTPATWWMNQSPTGDVRLIRLQYPLYCSPGRFMEIEKQPTHEEIHLEWNINLSSRVIFFRILSWMNFDILSGCKTPTNNIAGLVRFGVSLDQRKVVWSMPGQINHAQLISMIPTKEDELNVIDVNDLAPSAIEDSYTAAKEIVCNFGFASNP